MIEWLEDIDRAIVLAVNGIHTPFLDEFFWLISARWPWIPLYLLLVWLIFRIYGFKKTAVIVGMIAGTIAIADFTSVLFFKQVFLRYRPSHHALLTDRLHFYAIDASNFYKGGMYGFVSSHATNFFALSLITGLAMRRYYPSLLWVMLGISALICFSRLYLGVHYLSDLVGGALWGSFIALLVFRFILKPYIAKNELE